MHNVKILYFKQQQLRMFIFSEPDLRLKLSHKYVIIERAVRFGCSDFSEQEHGLRNDLLVWSLMDLRASVRWFMISVADLAGIRTTHTVYYCWRVPPFQSYYFQLSTQSTITAFFDRSYHRPHHRETTSISLSLSLYPGILSCNSCSFYCTYTQHDVVRNTMSVCVCACVMVT